jgi:ribonuclease HI
MTQKKKFYGVAKGRVPGVYTTWFGAGGAEAQVRGVQGAQFKGFTTRAEAEEFVKTGFTRKWPVKKSAKSPQKRSTPTPNKDHIVIYTDGGAINNPGPGGYGVVIQSLDGQQKEISGGYRLTTNNRMELTACIVGLASLPEKKETVSVVSDSKYVVDGITKGWAKRWRAKNWMRTKTDRAINPDLWQKLLDLCERHQVDFIWVKGHAGHPENERCDQLAVTAARGGNLDVDEVYEAEKTAHR